MGLFERIIMKQKSSGGIRKVRKRVILSQSFVFRKKGT